ncbi:MAG: phosphonate C-P lyase system protein PhnH [Rhodospirillales bacterium]|nr:phosphonate C-P lyase system protein PhnH [Rhodospirillales bacterium]MDE2197612.1 phosphonate C-P lyase system protein PhnH [Rhodospirillales bacterium]MDE2574773.1 phosphonate C-P lyase system protein PhnH [Rhodospirillales bacterium]
MLVDLPGFADPVRDAQACFRTVLAAMARPGTVHQAGEHLAPPAGLHRATAAVLLTLVDGETSLHVTDGFEVARDWIGFHCDMRAATAGHARFVLAERMVDLAALAAGSDEAPEESATLILQLPELQTGTSYLLDGPGLAHPAPFRARGLGEGFVAAWAANRARFPCGVDLILCSGTQVAALPRSLRITEG